MQKKNRFVKGFFSLFGFLFLLLLIPLSVVAYWTLFLDYGTTPKVANQLSALLADGSERKPILVVHGLWDGNADKFSKCAAEDGPYAYKTLLAEKRYVPLGQIGEWLVEDGYEPYFVILSTDPTYTASVLENGRCLEQQMRNLMARLGEGVKGEKYTIIAHSMGGMVARSCLVQSEFCRSVVDRLITFGSPHNGAPAFYGLPNELTEKGCEADPGMCDMAGVEQNKIFNEQTPNQPGIRYTFIGGTQGLLNGPLHLLHENDGLVGAWSAIGMLLDDQGRPSFADWAKPNPPTVYWVQNKHAITRREGHAYHEAPAPGQVSEAYQCIRYALGHVSERPSVCRTPPEKSSGKLGA